MLDPQCCPEDQPQTLIVLGTAPLIIVLSILRASQILNIKTDELICSSAIPLRPLLVRMVVMLVDNVGSCCLRLTGDGRNDNVVGSEITTIISLVCSGWLRYQSSILGLLNIVLWNSYEEQSETKTNGAFQTKAPSFFSDWAVGFGKRNQNNLPKGGIIEDPKQKA